MRIEITNWRPVANDPDLTVESVERMVVVMDNGERYQITEVRPSASQCQLEVRSDQSMSIEPIVSNVVRVGRA